jgi:ubiquinone/menaquinone biosynthesis C-methylase UbiE
MFSLSPADSPQKILDCGGGPASFNVEMTDRGYSVVSCDPIYQFSVSEIEQRIQATYAPIVEGVRANRDRYVWHTIQSPEQLGEIRLTAMRRFLADFPTGLQSGRYVVDQLPTLSFRTGQFDLALCGHLLFTYSDQLSTEFHLNAIRELCRVANEVRIFPILDVSGDVSPILPIVLEELPQQGYSLAIKPVSYEFQRGGNQLLQVSRKPESNYPV